MTAMYGIWRGMAAYGVSGSENSSNFVIRKGKSLFGQRETEARRQGDAEGTDQREQLILIINFKVKYHESEI